MGMFRLSSGYLSKVLKGFGSAEQIPQNVLKTGYHDLDCNIGGLLPGKLYLIGAQPGVGKSTFVYNLMLKLGVEKGEPVLLYSLGTSADIVVRRLTATLAKVNFNKAWRGKLDCMDTQRLTKAEKKLRDTKIFIDDTPYCNIEELISCAEKAAGNEPIKVIFIDHLQLLSEERDSDRHQLDMAKEFYAMKKMAEKYGIAIVILSQLSKRFEFWEDKCPKIQEFKISTETLDQVGGIIGLYRDDYYNSESEMKGIMDLYILKNSQGACGVVQLVFSSDHLGIYGLKR